MDLGVWKSLSLLRHFTLNILSRVRPMFTSAFTAFKGEVQLFFNLDEFVLFTVSSSSNGLEVSGIDTAARLQCFSRLEMKPVWKCKKLLFIKDLDWLQKDQKPRTHQTKKMPFYSLELKKRKKRNISLLQFFCVCWDNLKLTSFNFT